MSLKTELDPIKQGSAIHRKERERKERREKQHHYAIMPLYQTWNSTIFFEDVQSIRIFISQS